MFTGVLTSDAMGIVLLAWDVALDCRVALRCAAA